MLLMFSSCWEQQSVTDGASCTARRHVGHPSTELSVLVSLASLQIQLHHKYVCCVDGLITDLVREGNRAEINISVIKKLPKLTLHRFLLCLQQFTEAVLSSPLSVELHRVSIGKPKPFHTCTHQISSVRMTLRFRCLGKRCNVSLSSTARQLKFCFNSSL